MLRVPCVCLAVTLAAGCSGSATGLVGDPDAGPVVAISSDDAGAAPDGAVVLGADAESPTPDAGPPADAAGDSGLEPPLTTVSFAATDEDFKNPERGFFYGYLGLTASEGSYAYLANPRDDLPGYTLAATMVRLDNYRSVDLPASKLTELSDAIGRVRDAGLKLVLRFAYCSPSSPLPGDSNPEADAPLPVVLRHIEQLAPIIQANADVIAVTHAGFVGQWGEWHHSSNGLTDNVDPFNATDAERQILDALLAAHPTSRMVQLRYPMHKMSFYGPTALTEAEAFTDTNKARVGHHNDCYFASANDLYTYPNDATQIAQQKAYVGLETRFTPHGGETCRVDPARIGCSTVLSEMAMLHTGQLNRQYNVDVLSSWKSNGCFAEIARRLGYRLELTSVKFSERVKPGGVLSLEVHLRNSGFASLFNPRPVFVVLDSGSTRLAAQLGSVDPRRWPSGADSSFTARLRVPATAAAGTWRLSLWLPDDAEALRSRPVYSVRFANSGTWEAASGLNLLTSSLAVDPSAPGESDPSARQFVEVP